MLPMTSAVAIQTPSFWPELRPPVGSGGLSVTR